ncbi:MAG: chemotaxis protein [Nitratiruptor sp.]|nr:chemotaxis protein [Nitratiruptor sp.]NPA83526.1 PAS domain-containing protein [Campylobacterota bacterium]
MESGWDMFIETEVPQDELIISRTDLDGVITYANETFARISGYEVEELIGKPHNILRHPDMPKRLFRELWETIQAGKVWRGYVKNLRKDRGFYWVYAEVSGVYRDGELVEYKSMRSWVAPQKRVEMQRLYDQIRLDDGEQVRTLAYIPAQLYKRWVERSREEGCTPEELLKKLI